MAEAFRAAFRAAFQRVDLVIAELAAGLDRQRS
jgi:hypothetical protein